MGLPSLHHHHPGHAELLSGPKGDVNAGDAWSRQEPRLKREVVGGLPKDTLTSRNSLIISIED